MVRSHHQIWLVVAITRCKLFCWTIRVACLSFFAALKTSDGILVARQPDYDCAVEREILDADGDPAFAMCICKGSRRLAASRKDTQVVQTVGVVMLVE